MRKPRSTTPEERLAIVQDCLANDKNYGAMALRYQCSYQQVRNWVKRYEEMGAAGLEDRRGRRPGTMPSRTPEEELREKYKAWTEYLKNWFGFMENNEIVSISPMSGGDFANTILLKKLSKSKRTDDEEIAIAIFSELSLFRKEIQLWCKVLALRTVIIPEDPILIELGERPGTYHNTVNLGLWNTGKELLRFKIMNDGIMIHDVHFRFKSFS